MPVDWSRQEKRYMYGRNRQCVPAACPLCGSERWITVDNARKGQSDVCSSCTLDNGVKPRTGIYKLCATCGIEFYVRPAHIEKRVYCSAECRYADEHTAKECEFCHARYKIARHDQGDSRFCSARCYHASHRNQMLKTCETCGKQFSVISSQSDRRFCSRLCYLGISQNNPMFGKSRPDVSERTKTWWQDPANRQAVIDRMTGEGNPNYKGFRATYRGIDWPKIAASVRKRDNRACQYPKCNEAGTDLPVHHIVPFREFTSSRLANHPSNLITVCGSHHMALEQMPSIWHQLDVLGLPPPKYLPSHYTMLQLHLPIFKSVPVSKP